MNVDKGNQGSGGTDAQVLGDFANLEDCESSDFTYQLKELSNLELPEFEVTTDVNGDAWLILGTDSGFEGTTTVNRKDWGLEWNVALEAGGFLVADKVKLNLEVQAALRS